MPGVAHTFGSELFKEIHFSLDHIKNCAPRARDEINGVLTHEAVHCFQYTGKEKHYPTGLGEGIAGVPNTSTCRTRILYDNDLCIDL